MKYVRFLTAVIVISVVARSGHAEPLIADVLLSGGTLIDGTGTAGRPGDVAIHDGRIVGVGKLQDVEAQWTIDCSGMIVCPGFIDLHNHSDRQVVAAATRSAMNYVTQGCTTMVTGNCGSGPVDAGKFYDAIDEHGAGTNVAHLLPQGGLRNAVIGTDLREPTSDELARMLELTEQAMRDGVWGMSTGLIYVPSSYATTDELISIAKVVSAHGGIYASHIRTEGTKLLGAVEEALQIGRRANLPVHVSHFKSSGRDAWGLVRRAAEMISAERKLGRKVTADQYPYIASSTSLHATLLPSWARAGGQAKFLKRLDSDETGPKLREIVATAIEKKSNGDAVRIARYRPRQDWVGLSLLAIAEREKRPVIDIAYEIFRAGGAAIVNFSMNEEDVRHIMAIDWVATASDGRAYLPGSDRPHPRNYGTFPRKIGYYSLQEGVLPLEQAIRSATGLPAEILGMTDRGLLKTGLAADVVVFDPKQVKDRATFDDPHQYSQGIQYVFVNGTPTVVAGAGTGALGGRALRHTTAAATGSSEKAE
jgi:N-acyl-D-aspartate/D-glutamate deacylase